MGWAQWSHVQFVIVNMAQGPVNLNKQRHEAQNALTRLMPVMNETPDLPSVHYTEYYCTCAPDNCQALFTCDQRTLTKIFLHGKITGQQYADMVELVDTLDLGSNERSYRFESCYPHQSPKGESLWGFTYYLFTLHFSLKSQLKFLEEISNSE